MSSSSSNEGLAGTGLSLPQIKMINSRSNIKTKTLKSSPKQADSGKGDGTQSMKEWNHTRCYLHLLTFPLRPSPVYMVWGGCNLNKKSHSYWVEESEDRGWGVRVVESIWGKFQKGGSPEQGGPNLCINPT